MAGIDQIAKRIRLMERGTGNPFAGFGNPFADFGDPFAAFGAGGLARPGSLLSGFFGGRDPFDDPFFTRPFGFGGGMMGPSIFGPSIFGPQGNGALSGAINGGNFLENRPPPPVKPRGPIIEELPSDDEEGDKEEAAEGNSRKHARSWNHEPIVEELPEEGSSVEEKRSKRVQSKRKHNRVTSLPSVPQTFTFQSSTVSYGGPNGAFYTSSTSRQTGGDGITLEESKEANSMTGKAAHRVSRGIGNKGHSVTRKLNSDGRVDTVQTLHNLNEGELTGFERAWEDNARERLPGWNPRMDMLTNGNGRPSMNGGDWQMRALPSPDGSYGASAAGRMRPHQFPNRHPNSQPR